jgi:two-component system, NarL family, nitrate/nitrite response regulator NarL
MVDLVLGDDQKIFVDALRAVLPERGIDVVGTASTLAATAAAVQRHRPDACLLARRFPDGDGIDAVGGLLRLHPAMKVLMLVADGDAHGMRRALDAGAAGYLDKGRGLTVLVDAIHAALGGRVVVELTVGSAARTAEHSHAQRLAAHLTARERECLELLVDGAPTTDMANRLGVSTTTVRTHVQAILTKLGVHSRLEAASFALRHGLAGGFDQPKGTVAG